MYDHEKPSELILSSEMQCARVDEISLLQSSPSLSDDVHMLPDVYRHPIVHSARRVVQERPAVYRGISEEGPIGARPLFVQHCYLDALMGDLLADVVDVSCCQQVLDVGCRMGEWICAMAGRYPHVRFIGVDSSEYCIGQARAQADRLNNALFLLKDVEGVLLALQDTRRFDLIHLSFCVGDLHIRDLFVLVRALVRLCRSRGMLVWSETDLPQTNSLVCERFNALVAQTMQMYGSGLGPGPMIGITPLMGYWLRRLGCRIVWDSARLIDVSHDVDTLGNFRRHFQVFSRQMKWPVLRSGLIWEAAYDRLCGEVMRDMELQSFGAICWLRCVAARFIP